MRPVKTPRLSSAILPRTWLAFSILLGPMTGGDIAPGPIARAVGLTVGFVVVAVLVGRPLLDRALVRLQRDHHTEPRRVLSLVVLLSLFGASFTQWAGIHAVFGGFVVGVTAGDSRHLKERTRAIIYDFVMTIFAPRGGDPACGGRRPEGAGARARLLEEMAHPFCQFFGTIRPYGCPELAKGYTCVLLPGGRGRRPTRGDA